MSMERSTAGPRIYVPISMPDHASQPTYAVLEFVGFSSPAPSSSNPHLLHSPAALHSPNSSAMLCLPSPVPSSSAPSPASFFPLSVNPPLPQYPQLLPPHNALIQSNPPSHFPISHIPDAMANTFYLPSPSHFLPHHPHHHPRVAAYPSSRLEVVNLDSPPSSPSSLAPSSASSASRESSKDKHSHSSAPITTHVVSSMGNASSVVLNKPMVGFNSSPSRDASSSMANGSSPRPMVNFSSSASDGGLCSMPMVNFSSTREDDIMQTQISVSQTDRETIVHTHSSNFRDVVRQLTGASSDDQDLLPVTLPARLANRVNNANMVQNVNVGAEVSASGSGMGSVGVNGSGGSSTKEQLGLRRAPLKLHERRKSSMKNLEKITTAYSFHGAAAEVSPIMNPSPVTPLASDFEKFCNASTPTSQGSSGLSSPINLISKGKVAMEAAAGRGDHNQQESGCFFLQRPPVSARPPPSPLEKSATPTLLSLFPESPACSPRDR